MIDLVLDDQACIPGLAFISLYVTTYTLTFGPIGPRIQLIWGILPCGKSSGSWSTRFNSI